jgi:hypothetical protein
VAADGAENQDGCKPVRPLDASGNDGSPRMTSIFMSYRRDDAAAYAGRLYDRLAAQFGQDHIFMDVDRIEPGDDFAEVIERSISAASVLLVLIGRH